jgi:hypothetical protein
MGINGGETRMEWEREKEKGRIRMEEGGKYSRF